MCVCVCVSCTCPCIVRTVAVARLLICLYFPHNAFARGKYTTEHVLIYVSCALTLACVDDFAGASSELPSARALVSKISQHTRKLFTERLAIFSPSSPTKRSVLLGIIKIALKAMSESLRCTILAANALQQIHVDCHVIYLFLHRYIADDATDKLFAALMGLIGQSATGRCLDTAEYDYEAMDELAAAAVPSP
jgi:hypothetical protein